LLAQFFFISVFFLVTVNASEILEEWTEVQWQPDNPVAFEKHGSFIIISARGSQGKQWGAIPKYENPAIGMYGSVYLHAASGDVQSGLSVTCLCEIRFFCSCEFIRT